MSAGAVSADATVMVVDEEEEIRNLVLQAFAGRGYRVLAARNGIEALLLAARHQGGLRLLIADVSTPPFPDGVELAKAMRRRRPDLKVLYLSRSGATASVEAEQRQGKGAFLAKPCNPETLLQAALGAMDLPPQRRIVRPRRSKRSILMFVPDTELRMHVARLLREEDYLVLESRTIGEALCIAQWHVGHIGLLLADSEALGRLPAELPERLMQARPRMRVLCATGCGRSVPLTERVRMALEQWGIAALGGGAGC